MDHGLNLLNSEIKKLPRKRIKAIILVAENEKPK
jgi:hypothetical protein